MDWILIGKIFLIYILPAIIIFKFCLWKHFQKTDELTIGNILVYLIMSLVPFLNVAMVIIGLMVTIGSIVYSKLNGIVIYKKK